MGNYMYANIQLWSKNHEIFKTKEEIEEKIKENNKQIENYKKKIFGMCCGNPRDLYISKDCEDCELDPIDVIENKLENIFEDELCGYEALIQENYRLNLFLENFDKIKTDE